MPKKPKIPPASLVVVETTLVANKVFASTIQGLMATVSCNKNRAAVSASIMRVIEGSARYAEAAVLARLQGSAMTADEKAVLDSLICRAHLK